MADVAALQDADGPRQARERLLSKSTVFAALDEAARHDLAATGFEREYAAGETIFLAGSAGQSMMAIARGTVRISMLAPTARDVVLADLVAGDVFGEVAMLDGGERSADAIALTNCRLSVFERRKVLAVLERHPSSAIQLVKLLCARLRRSDERMSEIAFMDLPSRLARALLRATESGAPPRRAKTSLSQTDLANLIGSSRENVNRCLRNWQKQGLVDIDKGWVVIPDREALEAMVAFG